MLTILKLQIAVVVLIASSFFVCCGNIDQEDLTHIYKNLLGTEHFNLENLAKEYSKVCPFYVDDYRLGKCPDCSYGPDCIINNKCCPDVIYGYLDYKCVSVVQRKGKSWFNETSYSMIASCPSSSNGSGRPSLNIKEEIPVTSLTTGLTYQTKQFAKCNDDNNLLVAWNTTFHCLETLTPWRDPLEINTFEDLVQNIELFYCEIRFSITAAATVPRPAVCNGGEEYYNTTIFKKPPKRLVDECNMTGLWEHFDQNIDFACRRLTLKYRYYKNVFCYICNPGLSFRYYKTKPVINTCNWIESDSDIKNACTTREQTPYYLPYKNVFCKLCNIMPDSFYSVNDDLYGTWVHVKNISEQTVAETVGGLFHSENSNDSFYFDTELIGNISYNSTNYSCLIPLQKMNGSTRSYARKISNCDRGNTNDDVKVPFYNCSSMFQNYLNYTKSGFNAYNRSLITETLYFSYILYIYLCDESFEINRFCEAVTEQQICSLKSNQSERAISCMLCQTGNKPFYKKHYRGSGFDVLMKITCSNVLEDFLFLDILSLLVAARESDCSVWFVPTGIWNTDYASLINERDECWDLPFIDSKTCHNNLGTYYFGSYRKLFSLLDNDWEAILRLNKRVSGEITQCVETVASSTNHTDESCREILCSEGHALVNDSCINEYDTYGNVLYELNYRFVVSNMEEETMLFGDGSVSRADGITFESTNITDICEGIQGIIQGQINENSSYSFQECEVKIDLNCSGDYIADIVIGSTLEISLSILIYFTKELPLIEKTLVDSLTQSFVFSFVGGSFVTLTLTPSDLRLMNTIHQRCSVRLAHATAASFISKQVIVNKLLICPQIELLKHEYIIDNASDTLQLVKNKIQVENYFIRGGRVRICLDDFNTYLEVTVSIPLFQRIYKVVDNVCTILSLFCLLITFITYCVFQSLRNVPGINNMNLTISLFCAQLTLKLGIWQPVDSTFCPVFGILIHFFWLSTFFAMNVCSFHMYRVFSSNTVTLSIFTKKTIVQYLLYTYLSPTVIVLLTIGSHLAISEGHSFGYGKTTCFLTDKVTAIVSFVCPCVFVFLLNILFFVKTFLSIRQTLNTSFLRRSTDRRDFLIYVRLWTLLGVMWPLLILDALLEMSIFSFLALTFNTLQGVFIFISFICNRRVLIKCRMCCSEDINSSTRLRDTPHMKSDLDEKRLCNENK